MHGVSEQTRAAKGCGGAEGLMLVHRVGVGITVWGHARSANSFIATIRVSWVVRVALGARIHPARKTAISNPHGIDWPGRVLHALATNTRGLPAALSRRGFRNLGTKAPETLAPRKRPNFSTQVVRMSPQLYAPPSSTSDNTFPPSGRSTGTAVALFGSGFHFRSRCVLSLVCLLCNGILVFSIGMFVKRVT